MDVRVKRHDDDPVDDRLRVGSNVDGIGVAEGVVGSDLVG